MISWLTNHVKNKGFDISFKANAMLIENTGLDLGRLSNELEKLFAIAKQTKKITPELVEQNIGISKDYNNFELKKAIGEKDRGKATRIINYFIQNPKDNPFVLTIGVLQTFFVQLLQFHGLTDQSKKM